MKITAKGVVGKILKEAPHAAKMGDIDVMISPIGVFARKNTAMLKEMYLGKIFYFLNKKLEEMATDAGIKEEKISKLIVDIYQLLGSEQVIKSVTDNIKGFKQNGLKKAIKDGKFKTFLVIEPFVHVKPENIKSAAELLGIPLEEKVYIPDEDTWTDVPVPVGVSYYNFLEHYSDVYSAIRGSEKYVGLTGQPTKRKSNFGGQALGNLDTFALITHDVPHIIDELYGARSDDHKSKKYLYNGIIQTGDIIPTPQKEVTGGTKYIFDLYMLGIGLEVK